jgi:hypothetical protein
MPILAIAAGVALGLWIFYDLYSTQKEENDAVAEFQKQLSQDLPPNPPNKYTGHPHGCLCKECISWVDQDHAEYLESKQR